MIRQTVRPWPQNEFYNPYQTHPATGWDTATRTFRRPLAQRSFVEFAPEIRNIIYHALLVTLSPVHVERGHLAYANSWENLDPESVGPQVMRQTNVMGLKFTSKAIYGEAMPLYYSQNTFRFGDSHGLKKFSDKLGPDPRRHVTKLSVVWFGGALARAAQSLGTFTGLRKLKLDMLSLYSFRKSKDQNLQIKIYGLKDLLRIRGLDVLEVSCQSFFQDLDRPINCTKAQLDAFEQRLQVLKQLRAVTFNKSTR